MNLRAIIIDDEIKVLNTLKSIIENNVQDVDVVATTHEPLKAPGVIHQWKPDIVFIDIEMPCMNGFEVLDCINGINFEIIFVTAYDQYGIDAIKRNALDYILKPVKTKEVVFAIEKAKDKITAGKPFNNEKQLFHLQQELSKNKIIKIPTLAGIDFIEANKIIYVKAFGTYCEVFCNNNYQLIMTKSIKEVLDIFKTGYFFRSHRSYVINISHIKRYIYSNSGTIVMSNGEEIPLSRRKKEEFNALIESI